MTDIKPWVKPHLRARLIDEAKAKEPKTAQGLTPITPAAPTVLDINAISAGDKVRVKKPADTTESPGWMAVMDHFDGAIIEVINVTTQSIQSMHGFWFSRKWIVEKL